MKKSVVQLYPQPGGSLPLKGLYLSHDGLAQVNEPANNFPLVYANFLTSIDGRIALKTSDEKYYRLPWQLKSDEDFLLLLELYAHADCIITHGGYMRSLSEGRLGNVLQLPQTSETEYIHDWRKQQGMKSNPDVTIVSGSLDFPWHSSLDNPTQKVHIVTGGHATLDAQQYWADKGHVVHRFGESNFVDVKALMSYLQLQGYRRVCLMAGPDLLQEMLLHGFVKYFFMTMSHQLLGGSEFKTMLNGTVLDKEGRLKLKKLYLDEGGSNIAGQWYVEFMLS